VRGPSALILAAASAALLGTSCGSKTNPGKPQSALEACQDSDQAFVRRAILALDGRRPWGQAEVDAYEDVLKGTRDRTGDDKQAKTFVIEAMMQEDSFRLRWSDFIMDALRVLRVQVFQSTTGYGQVEATSCYGPPRAKPVDHGELAAWVRDNYPSANNPPIPKFDMGDLLSSAIELDDISPVYRAQLFQLLAFPLPGANVSPNDLETARRQDFSHTFETAYLHRDMQCLPCHNSQSSVTFSSDPAMNRWFPMPGLFEKALFQHSNGASANPLKYRSMVRWDNVADGGGQSPYGWNGTFCGTFSIPSVDDPLGVDAYFGSVHSTAEDPRRGYRVSVWALEPTLRDGVDVLAAHGLQLDKGGIVSDPDAAFAYLVGASISEKVWAEILGWPLTVPNYFPRNADQRDILKSLTDTFVESHFSLKQLLVEVLTNPAFNLKTPDAGCGGGAYELPRIFNPWSNAETDPSMQDNSLGDAVFALSPRPLRRSLHQALEWPFAPDFPTGKELTFQEEIGDYIAEGEAGFRGLDFQGRAAWENAYGACKNQASGDDFISKLTSRAGAARATVNDAVLALKDRIIGEPAIEASSEAPALEKLIGSLNAAVGSDLDGKLRLACGAYVASPQFLLGGVVAPDTRVEPALADPAHDYAASCADIAARFSAQKTPYAVRCSGSTAQVEAP
jgi:hypothetical protein